VGDSPGSSTKHSCFYFCLYLPATSWGGKATQPCNQHQASSAAAALTAVANACNTTDAVRPSCACDGISHQFCRCMKDKSNSHHQHRTCNRLCTKYRVLCKSSQEHTLGTYMPALGHIIEHQKLQPASSSSSSDIVAHLLLFFQDLGCFCEFHQQQTLIC